MICINDKNTLKTQKSYSLVGTLRHQIIIYRVVREYWTYQCIPLNILLVVYTYNTCIHMYSAEYVPKIKSIRIIMEFMGLGVISWPISLLIIARIFVTLLVLHLFQVGNMIQWSLFRVRSWNNGMWCMFHCAFTKHLMEFHIHDRNNAIA